MAVKKKVAKKKVAKKKASVVVKPNKDGILFASLKSIQVEDGFNVRKNAKPEKEFVDSVRVNGVIHPIHVRWMDRKKSGLYIIDGERRFNAATMAGKGSVPIVNHGFIDDKQAFVISLTANENQKKLTRKEMLSGFARLKEEGFSLSQIANVMGVDTRTVTESMRVADKGSEKLKDSAKKGAKFGGVAPRAAARASSLPKQEQDKLVEKMAGKPLHDQLDEVRKVEKKLGVKKPGRQKVDEKAPSVLSPKSGSRMAEDVSLRMSSIEKELKKRMKHSPSHRVLSGQMMIIKCLKGDCQVSDLFGWDK